MPPGDGLAAAIEAAAEGDRILLSEGGYTFGGTLVLSKAVTIKGAGIGKTVLKSGFLTGRQMEIGAGAAVESLSFEGRKIKARSVTGFVARIGSGGGTLRDVEISGYTVADYFQSGVVELDDDNALMEGCRITGNSTAINNDAMTVCAGVNLKRGTVRGCTIASNSGYQAVGLWIKGGTAENCLVADNEIVYPGRNNKVLGTGAGVYADGGTLRGCVIAGNRGSLYSGAGGIYVGNAGARVENCVIAANYSPAKKLLLGHDIDGVSPSVASCFSDCSIEGDFGSGAKAGETFFADANQGDYTHIPGIRADKREALLGEAFLLSTDKPSPVWNIKSSGGEIVFTSDLSSCSFTPGAPGLYSVELVSGGETFLSKDSLKVGPIEVEASTLAGLEAAIDNAVDGTRISIPEGIEIVLSKTLVITKGLVISGAGYGKTTLSLPHSASARLMYVSHPDARIEGLTLKGGSLGIYGPVYGINTWIAGRGGTVANCRITGAVTKNHYQHGAIAVTSDDGYVGSCLIDGNHNLFQSTSGYGYGGGVALGAGIVENCLITNNFAMNGGGVAIEGSQSGILRNCTIYGNRADKTGGALLWQDGNKARVLNCVFASSTSSSLQDTSQGRPNWAPLTQNSAQYANMNAGLFNCAFSGSAATGTDSFEVQVPFIDEASGNLHPLPGASGLVDKGMDCEGHAETDFEGNVRKMGEHIDIGCYEHDSSQKILSFTASRQILFAGESVTLSGELSGAEAGESYEYSWRLVPHFGDAVLATGESVALELPAGRYSVHLSAASPSGSIVQAVPAIDFILASPRKMHVTAAENPSSAFPYDSPAIVATNLADAVSVAITGGEIELSEGTHLTDGEIVLSQGVRLYGAGRELTTISHTKKNPSRVLTVNHPSAIVENLGVTGGCNATYSINDNAIGVGVWIGPGGGTLRNAKVFGNVSRNYFQHGAGVAVSGALGLVDRCIIEGNTNCHREAQVKGGGAFLAAGQIRNSLIRGNRSYYGGGLFLSGGGKAENCTIIANDAVKRYEGSADYGEGGGVYLSSSWTGTLRNTLICGNSSYKDGYAGCPEVKSEKGKWDMGFERCFFPVAISAFSYPENGNLSGDPLLEGELGMPSKNSPLRDAGTYNPEWMDGALDLAGNSRLAHKKQVDIGCYELPWHSPATLVFVR